MYLAHCFLSTLCGSELHTSVTLIQVGVLFHEQSKFVDWSTIFTKKNQFVYVGVLRKFTTLDLSRKKIRNKTFIKFWKTKVYILQIPTEALSNSVVVRRLFL